MAQSIVKRGSVVLIRYPFTDLTSAKVRPALVLTPDHLLPRLDAEGEASYIINRLQSTPYSLRSYVAVASRRG